MSNIIYLTKIVVTTSFFFYLNIISLHRVHGYSGVLALNLMCFPAV